MATTPGGDDGQERSEAPTPRRRDEARREGRIPRSHELSAAVLLLAGATMLAGAGGTAMGRGSRELLVEGTRWLVTDPLTIATATALLRLVAGRLLVATGPFLAIVAMTALAVGLAQGRGVLSLTPIQPKLSHLDPIGGLRRIVGMQGVVTLVKAIAKFAVLGLATWLALRHAWPQLTTLTAVGPEAILETIRSLSLRLALLVGLAFLVIAAADYGYQVYRHEKGLRMTKQEVIQEHKETDGNPLVKSRIQSLARAMARKRMLRDVAKADVVITNPTHIAVALKYDQAAASAPIVLAMGERKLAERIKAVAARAGVPMVENRPLAHALLASARVGRPIPPALYAAVAEVLAFVYRRRGGVPR